MYIQAQDKKRVRFSASTLDEAFHIYDKKAIFDHCCFGSKAFKITSARQETEQYKKDLNQRFYLYLLDKYQHDELLDLLNSDNINYMTANYVRLQALNDGQILDRENVALRLDDEQKDHLELASENEELITRYQRFAGPIAETLQEIAVNGRPDDNYLCNDNSRQFRKGYLNKFTHFDNKNKQNDRKRGLIGKTKTYEWHSLVVKYLDDLNQHFYGKNNITVSDIKYFLLYICKPSEFILIDHKMKVLYFDFFNQWVPNKKKNIIYHRAKAAYPQFFFEDGTIDHKKWLASPQHQQHVSVVPAIEFLIQYFLDSKEKSDIKLDISLFDHQYEIDEKILRKREGEVFEKTKKQKTVKVKVKKERYQKPIDQVRLTKRMIVNTTRHSHLRDITRKYVDQLYERYRGGKKTIEWVEQQLADIVQPGEVIYHIGAVMTKKTFVKVDLLQDGDLVNDRGTVTNVCYTTCRECVSNGRFVRDRWEASIHYQHHKYGKPYLRLLDPEKTHKNTTSCTTQHITKEASVSTRPLDAIKNEMIPQGMKSTTQKKNNCSTSSDHQFILNWLKSAGRRLFLKVTDSPRSTS